MSNKECQYFFNDLVYVDFGDHKIIGEVESHRICENKTILYNIRLVGGYVPVTMIHKLTPEQEDKYRKFLDECCIKHHYNKEAFIEEMQKIFIEE